MIVECFTRLATGEEGSGCGAVDRAAPSDTRNNFILIGYQLFPIKEEFPSDVPSVTRWLNYF